MPCVRACPLKGGYNSACQPGRTAIIGSGHPPGVVNMQSRNNDTKRNCTITLVSGSGQRLGLLLSRDDAECHVDWCTSAGFSISVYPTRY